MNSRQKKKLAKRMRAQIDAQVGFHVPLDPHAIATGHPPAGSGSGPHDARPRRVRTRASARQVAIRDST